MARSLVHLIEDRVSRAQSLHELDWWAGKVFSLEITHHLPASQGHNHIRINLVSVLGWLCGFQSCLEFIDALETLNNRVHVACVAEIFKAGWHHNRSFLIHGCCTLLWRHILQE